MHSDHNSDPGGQSSAFEIGDLRCLVDLVCRSVLGLESSGMPDSRRKNLGGQIVAGHTAVVGHIVVADRIVVDCTVPVLGSHRSSRHDLGDSMHHMCRIVRLLGRVGSRHVEVDRRSPGALEDQILVHRNRLVGRIEVVASRRLAHCMIADLDNRRTEAVGGRLDRMVGCCMDQTL